MICAYYSYKQAEDLIAQLNALKKINPNALIDNQKNKVIDKNAYYKRIKQIIAKVDTLIAFQVNKSEGTQYTIDMAKQKGILIKKYSYKIN